jgi:hypothetical protein
VNVSVIVGQYQSTYQHSQIAKMKLSVIILAMFGAANANTSWLQSPLSESFGVRKASLEVPGENPLTVCPSRLQS